MTKKHTKAKPARIKIATKGATFPAKVAVDALPSGLQLLGLKGKDRITGFSGVITSINYDLYGCCQIVLSPPVDKDGKKLEGHWFDTNRIDVLTERVMPVPTFKAVDLNEQRGAAEKPPGHT